MIPTDRPLLLATHSGTFHADDCLAYVILTGALGLDENGGTHELVRTRDQARLKTADIVWDVGGVADEAAWRFDHHQPGAPRAEDGAPLSSAGLVWRAVEAGNKRSLGQRYVRNALAKSGFPDVDDSTIERIAEGIRSKFVRHVDLVDNGVERAAPTDLTSMVETFNGAWDAPSQSDPVAFEEFQRRGFLRASRMVADAVERQIEKERGAAFAYQAVVEAWKDCKAGASGLYPDVLELPRGMPWQRPAFELAMPILYVTSPEPDGRWKVQAMPAEKGSFASRLEMPAAWRGLQDAALEQACGIAGALFVHRGGHLAIAATRDAALAIARACLANKLSPAEALRKAWGR
ncbi:MYG1 family protein [Roseomonas sp. SSH11]|uniref:MYG1 family protein n=1 Tax=Pararoseomonas baculiformis TaxID=2820812 RepID=A0ABS4ADJ3_9PROT|nr:MYG1 family protein [Pararoseomonas baculiformis]MBP0445086.1 MYG1 family protein [Pararoseomonas baculiformis]